MWEDTVQADRPQTTIWQMRTVRCTPNATNTHSGYVTLIAFPLQQWFVFNARVIPTLAVLSLDNITRTSIVAIVHSLVVRVTSIFLCAKHSTSEKRSYCLADHFVIRLYTAVRFHDFLQEFFLFQQFSFQLDVLFVSPHLVQGA